MSCKESSSKLNLLTSSLNLITDRQECRKILHYNDTKFLVLRFLQMSDKLGILKHGLSILSMCLPTMTRLEQNLVMNNLVKIIIGSLKVIIIFRTRNRQIFRYCLFRTCSKTG